MCLNVKNPRPVTKYKKDFEQFILTKNGAEVLSAIMIQNDLKKTLDLIKRHREIENQAFSELYLIYGLFDVYYQKAVEQESSLSLLYQLSNDASNEANKQTAKSVLGYLEKYNTSKKAPEFALYSNKGQLLSLHDFQGKPIYMGFWADWSIPSLRELKVMKVLEEEYGDKIHFISINVDENVEKMKSTINSNSFSWTFLHYGNDYEIKEKYQVKTIPSYFLIDEKGNFIQAMADGPTTIERRLVELVK